METSSPILTYQMQGTTKSGIKSQDHAIIYMDGTEPTLLEGEEHLSLQPIKAIGRNPRVALEPASRINYSKTYTVEHNLEVHFIGHIAPESRFQFVADLDAVRMSKRHMY